MGWKTAVWGSEDASPDTRRRLVMVSIILALTLFGFLVDFVPRSVLALDRCLPWILIAGCALPVTMLLFPGERARIVERARKHGGLAVAVGMCSLVPFFGFACWVIFAISLPWAYTAIFGVPFLTAEVMQTEHRWSRRSCHWYVKGDFLVDAFPSSLCISERDYARHPDQRVQVILTGKRSVFGSNIQGLIVAETSRAAPPAAIARPTRH